MCDVICLVYIYLAGFGVDREVKEMAYIYINCEPTGLDN